MKHKATRAEVAVKSVSWAVVSGVIIGTTAYLETQNIRAAAVTAMVSALIKTPVYSIHEVVFARVWSRRKARLAA